MPWSKPDFVEITLNMEVTAYVNTDDKQLSSVPSETSLAVSRSQQPEVNAE